MASIWLAHVTTYNTITEEEEILYFSSSKYVSGTSNLPPNGVANTYYEPRIQQPASLQNDMFTARATYGAAKTTHGLLELYNSDGELDYLSDYVVDGRNISIIYGEVFENESPTWTLFLSGTLEQIELTWEKVLFKIYDKQKLLEKNILLETFAGTNSGPTGLESTPDALQGKKKPRLFGKVFKISPPAANTSLLIYLISSSGFYTASAVYDNGVALTKEADYTSESDMTSNAPSAGCYRCYPAGGYIRLGTTPQGTLTADAQSDSISANLRTGQLIYDLLIDDGLLSPGEIDSASFSALDTANTAIVGYWVTEATTYKTLIEAFCNTVRAWYAFTADGIFFIKQVSKSLTTPLVIIRQADIITCNRFLGSDEGKGLAIHKVKLNYKKFYTVQSTFAGSVPEETRISLKEQWRTVEVENSAILTLHPFAGELEQDTYFTDISDATAEANARLSLYEETQIFFAIRCVLEKSIIENLVLGGTIRVEHARLGINNGTDLILIGFKTNLQLNLVDLTLWK